MSFAKWLGASLGWSFGGPIGGILGFVLGSVVDGFSDGDIKDFQRTSQRRVGGGGKTHRVTSSGDFEVSLLILAAVVIKSDGNIDQRELNYVRQNFKKMYGEQRASRAFKLFKGIMQNDNISTRQVCYQIRRHMDHASRLQLLHFLFGIAKADGNVSQVEMQTIRRIAGYLYISQADFESIQAMFYNEVSSAYKILEISKTASDNEVKKAYRRMVKKHHPDKVKHLGDEHVKGAEEKFRKVQQAYEKIQKERGL